MLTNEQHQLLDSIYYNADGPASFSGITRLYDEAHRRNPTITRPLVTAYLRQQRTYQLHREDAKRVDPKAHLSKRFIQASRPGQLALDSWMLTGMRVALFPVALIAIDVFTKMVYVEFERKLNAQSSLSAFERILRNKYRRFRLIEIFSDRG